MLYKDRLKNLATIYPQLSRVWIRTDNPRVPLKSVWIDEAALRKAVAQHSCAACESETAELADDPSVRAA